MNELLKKLTEEMKSQMQARLASKEVQDVLAKTKAAEDSGTFKFVISTSAVDRQGESIDQSGWDFTNFMKNPVLLWGHDYDELPVGAFTRLYTEGEATYGEGKFAPADANPFAQQLRKLYDLQMANATSVGFLAKEMQGNVITKAELLEVSMVNVPANPEALSVRQIKEMGLELELLKTKGLEIKVKGEEKIPAEGDACQLPDGSQGVIELNDEGEMVCVPQDIVEELEEDKIVDIVATDHKDGLTTIHFTLESGKTTEHQTLSEGLTKFMRELMQFKSGRVLSEENRTLIKTTIDGLTATITALQELYDATEPQGGGRSVEPPASGGETKAKAGDFPEEAMQNWLLQKQVIGAVVTALSEAGANLNKKIKSQSKGI